VVKSADHIIDMGPEGGAGGGLVIAEGTPEMVAANPDSFTGQFLAPILQGRAAVTTRRRLRSVQGPDTGSPANGSTRSAGASGPPGAGSRTTATARTGSPGDRATDERAAATRARRKAARLV
ncbi:MAG TPA: hypothetical protein VIU11_12670, partial [Nakamurella sp.]